MKSKGVGIWRALNPTKSSLSERYLKTWRERVEKYMHHNNTKTWFDVAEKIANQINKSISAAHGYRPIDVASDKKLQRDAYLRMYGSKIGGVVQEGPEKVGDSYRIANLKDAFTKGFRQSFSSDKYTLSKVIYRGGKSLLKLKDKTGEVLPAHFYKTETKLVDK